MKINEKFLTRNYQFQAIHIQNRKSDIRSDTPVFNNQSKPKKLFSFIKSLRTDNSGVAPLKKEGQLVADTKQKANILNEQFKSVFTTESIDNTSSNTITHHHNT